MATSTLDDREARYARLAVKARFATEAAVRAAIARRATDPAPKPLKHYLLAAGAITAASAGELDAGLAVQDARLEDVKVLDLAILRGVLAAADKKAVLDHQQATFQASRKMVRVGDILVQAGRLDPASARRLVAEALGNVQATSVRDGRAAPIPAARPVGQPAARTSTQAAARPVPPPVRPPRPGEVCPTCRQRVPEGVTSVPGVRPRTTSEADSLEGIFNATPPSELPRPPVIVPTGLSSRVEPLPHGPMPATGNPAAGARDAESAPAPPSGYGSTKLCIGAGAWLIASFLLPWQLDPLVGAWSSDVRQGVAMVFGGLGTLAIFYPLLGAVALLGTGYSGNSQARGAALLGVGAGGVLLGLVLSSRLADLSTLGGLLGRGALGDLNTIFFLYLAFQVVIAVCLAAVDLRIRHPRWEFPRLLGGWAGLGALGIVAVMALLAASVLDKAGKSGPLFRPGSMDSAAAVAAGILALLTPVGFFASVGLAAMVAWGLRTSKASPEVEMKRMKRAYRLGFEGAIVWVPLMTIAWLSYFAALGLWNWYAPAGFGAVALTSYLYYALVAWGGAEFASLRAPPEAQA